MKALRKKFVLFAMIAVTFLLVVLMSAIGCTAWYMTERQADAVMETLLHSDGMFGRMDFEKRPPLMQPLDMDRMKATRFFTVQLGNDGNAVKINIEQIDAVDREMALQYAENVRSSSKKAGSIDGYKFAVKENAIGMFIAFMDTSGQRSTLCAVLLASCGIVFVCWLLVFLFTVLLSEKVVRPVWQGIEKQKQFITNAGHELKTPLTVIQANNDAMILIHGENKYNINIRSQIERLTALTNTMLTLAKFEEQTKQSRTSLNVSVLLNHVVQEFKEAADKKRITIQIHSEQNVMFQLNEEAFLRLLSLLTDNAVKYTPDDGEISFSVYVKNNTLWITEENTCDGCQIQDAERLFDRFYRADMARTQSSVGGYGIGLSAARAICESFNGTLCAEVKNGNRICFTAMIPEK